MVEEGILKILREMQEDGLIHPNESITSESSLYGANGILSSLNLVNLLVEVESWVLLECDKPLNLTNDKVFSARNSPFATVGSLAEFVNKELEASEA